MEVQEEAGTGTALGTVGEEEEVVAEVEVEEVGEVVQGQVVGTPQDLHLVRAGPVAGWETFPSVPASARRGKQAGSWGPVQVGVEEEGEEMLHHWSVGQAEALGEEE